MSEHTAFSDAIENGDSQAVESLIQQHPDLVNHPHWTPPPLHCAVLWNQPKIAEILLDNGADIEIREPDRLTTPLRYAIVYCKTQMIPLLLSRGANAGSIAENGTTALQLARDAAAGGYEEYDDMPSLADYSEVVDLLQQLGVE
ncbi:MAG: ankyrin repeat domain-containing protein [Planctomycetaceae bacterium]|jgi:ankyrin repeat protein|nr:ankyrin repeat domain-containing protein [Planctomycetaceae bacterium]MBT6154519.1 ankyrin repeat domain-containing protein [Planctomycetaceae bacterium]MBT6486549.1 ankyrin repeat domain-containing protein [Planctomycetaceae bacterium]MBT6496985.1 ankyrin repeat domain-containing protein [Planctomycetaceae bacterium]